MQNIGFQKFKGTELLFHGWTVIRFWGKDIMKNTDECVKVIDETVFDIIAFWDE